MATVKQYFVYILANKSNRVLYTGITGNFENRMYEHRLKMIPGFTQKYNVTRLVYYEEFPNPTDAISAEKKIKGWSRKKKNQLVESKNPQWQELGI